VNDFECGVIKRLGVIEWVCVEEEPHDADHHYFVNTRELLPQAS
jgi:hypothetical protein